MGMKLEYQDEQTDDANVAGRAHPSDAPHATTSQDDRRLPLDGDAETLAQTPSRTARPNGDAWWKTLALEVALILAGGVVGTLARVALSVIIGHALDAKLYGFPVDILLINVTGSLALGILAGWRDPQSRTHELIWLAGAVGFLGAYTTFSSFALGIVTLTANGHTLVGLLYLTISASLGLLAMELGLGLGERLQQRPRN